MSQNADTQSVGEVSARYRLSVNFRPLWVF
jgi:hypothetical protein